MVEVFEAKTKLLESLGWSENPFVKDLRFSEKEMFLKFYCPFESNEILKRLAFDAKACLFLGPKGVGKTSATYFVAYGLPESEFEPVIFKAPPQSLEQLAQESGYARPSVLDRWMKTPFSRQKLVDALKRNGKKIVFFIDEAHLEKNKDMYMEFKYLLDDVPNLRLVISALSKEGFPDSLLHLVGETNTFSRNHFSAAEMTRIISHRIEAVGGSGLKPFPQAYLNSVLSEQNLLSPRYVFDELNAFLAGLATGENPWKGASKHAGDSLVEAAVLAFEQTTSHASWWPQLSPSQQSIMTFLIGGNGATLQEIMEATQLSMNTSFNALYQLRGDDDAERKRKPGVPFPLVQAKPVKVGARKKNVYVVVNKVRNLFTTH
ncbi:ATP-binding protein [Candidatus Micrarchaeota archaeon]|nr:ATP-binding protein [Candidatus Micrarchaeota archaeon]